MKNKLTILFILLMLLITTACSPDADIQDISSTATPDIQKEVLTPVYAKQIENGSYEINVDSSSSMFRVVRCELIVEDEEMQAVMTMSGKGYGMVYMGTSEEAVSASEDTYIPFVMNENEEKTFTVPVEALNMETDCAAWSIRKEKWYDRTLIFMSDAIPAEAIRAE